MERIDKQKLNNKISAAIICTLLVCVPLFLHDKYFDALEAKALAYRVISYIALVFIAVGLMIARDKKAFFYDMSLSDYGILGFSLCALISGLLCGNIKASFFGDEGWSVGFYVILSLCIIYFFVSRNLFPDYDFKNWFFVVCNLIFIIGIVRFFGFDLFSLHSGMEEKQIFQYISTFGNTNWYLVYLCCTVIFTAVIFLFEKEKKRCYIQTVTLILGIFNIIVGICDAVYFILTAVVIFVAPAMRKELLCLKRACIILLIFGVEIILCDLLPCFDGLLATAEGLSLILIDFRVGLIVAAVSLILLLLLIKYGEKITDKSLRNISVAMCVIAVASVIGYVTFAVLTFSDNFGTRRGLIWRVCTESFLDFGFFEKLIGVGPEMLKSSLQEISDTFGRLTVSAHSEFFQVLLSEGILGFAFWLTAWFGLFASYFKYKIYKSEALPYFAALVGIFAQGFFNSSMAATIMLTVIFAAIYKSKIIKLKGEKNGKGS